MCSREVVDRKMTKGKMDMLGLGPQIGQATANGVRWQGHVLRREDNSVLRAVLDLEVSGKRKREQRRPGRSKRKRRLVKEVGCPESSKVKQWCANNCEKNRVNPAISSKGTIPIKTE